MKNAKWTWKQWGALLIPFFGLTTIGGVVSAGQKLAGWAAAPAIEKAQAEGLRKMDSAQAVRMDTLKAWLDANKKETMSRIGNLESILSDVPAVREAAKRRRERQREREEAFGPRAHLADIPRRIP